MNRVSSAPPGISWEGKMNTLRKMSILVVVISFILAGSPMMPGTASDAPRNQGGVIYSTSPFPIMPPVINGTASSGEWEGAAVLNLPHGTLKLMSDAINLYVLFDMTGDTTADSITSGNDYFRLAFDVDGNHQITAGVDVLYSLLSGATSLCKATYLGPGTFSTCGSTDSQLAVGFSGSPLHRVYEMAISQVEINTGPGGMVFLGAMVHSKTPAFDDWLPVGFLDSLADSKAILLEDMEVKLLILTPSDWVDDLLTLKDHKNYTNMPAYVQSWNNLDASLHAKGWDIPERIKMGIARYEWFSDTQYVMLVGDSNLFPMRYTMTDRADQAAYNRAYYVTDLYYADLYESDRQTFENWDSNANHYYGELHGETITGVVNVDKVDTNPDVMVGRVPASSLAEVNNYVTKVINYEYNTYKADWSMHSLQAATIDWSTTACQTNDFIVSNYLDAYTNTKLYQAGNPCATTSAPTSANINAVLNAGARFALYIGHGAPEGWSIPGDWYEYADLASLTNQDMPFIAFAASCSTARYATEPPYSPYTDIASVHHTGTTAGEVFTDVPPQPNPLQTVDNPRAFAEAILVEDTDGAVGYIGASTGSQTVSYDLAKYFYQSLDYGYNTLGGMWRYMINAYYAAYPIPASLSSPDWFVVATAHQPWKFPLMGDPSLRIYGVSRFQKADFADLFSMNHDGWEGGLDLDAVQGDYIESTPNMLGSYYSAGGGTYKAYGYVRTWDYPIAPGPDWPDHMMKFYVDFNGTPSSSDDQLFDSYLFTQDRSMMAGVTYWNSIPFGFYAERDGGVPGEETHKFRLQSEIGISIITKADFTGVFDMTYDGWEAGLILWAVEDNFAQSAPNLLGVLIWPNGQQRQVRGYVRTPTYPLDANFGPDHTILLYIDFPNTPSNPADDQWFKGYLATQTKSFVAGTTIWNSTLFGWVAERMNLLHLPVTWRP